MKKGGVVRRESLSSKVTEGRKRSRLLERIREWLEGEEREESAKGATCAFNVSSDSARRSVLPLHHERLLQGRKSDAFHERSWFRINEQVGHPGCRGSGVDGVIPPSGYNLAYSLEGYAA